MREIGTIASEQDAKVLADYLLTLDITTKVTPGKDGWAVWVHREDRLDRARQVLGEFRIDPADPRFHAAAPAAKLIRKDAEKKDADYRKRTRDLRDRWEGAMYRRAPLAFGLIVASIVVTVLQNAYWPTFDALSFSVVSFDMEGGQHDSGFSNILAGQVWRLVTPIFLHFGFVHILLNAIGMRYLGEVVEMRKGALRFAFLVLVSGIAGNVGEFYKSGGLFGGMSGVLFALAGYLWVKGQVDPQDGLALSNRSFNNMLLWFMAGIILPQMAPNAQGLPFRMANVDHAVGLATGVLFGLLKF